MRALLTGIGGQTGSYLAELLLARGWDVHGMVRRHSYAPGQTARIEHLRDRLYLHYGDMTDALGLSAMLADVQPHHVYNLAAQSHVAVSFDVPEYTGQVDALGTLRLLECIRLARGQSEWARDVRVYQASTSELFGSSPPPQSFGTPFCPQSPYACAKLYAHEMAGVYRRAYGMHVVRGVLFNHESKRRGETFVTRKVTMAVARIALGLQQTQLMIGNLAARRDWGHAADYAEAIHSAVCYPDAEDWIVATGESHSVEDLVVEAFGVAGIRVVRTGSSFVVEDLDESVLDRLGLRLALELPITVCTADDPRMVRPAEVDHLCGDASKARSLLGWAPRHTFKQLIAEMVESDLLRAAGRSLLS